MNTQLTDVLVICTRNRDQDLSRALASIALLKRWPTALLVVDSSDGSESQQLVMEASFPGEVDIQYVHTEAGLTYQRNVALDMVSNTYDVVHFIDDDVELDPAYTSELLDAFTADPQLAGAGGLIEGSARTDRRIIARLLWRDSNRPGIVLPGGFNIGALETPSEVDVDWLPGCSMSYRASAIQGIRFDESRRGYALGEDVDFGLRVSRRGTLRHIPRARLVHHMSPMNRHDRATLEDMAIRNRWKLATDHPHKVKKWAIVVTTVPFSIIRTAYALSTFKPSKIRIALAEVRGLWELMLGKQHD